ncbi:NUDIX hydrolase [Marivirga harenae]|uniref:NUDIX hydrolase n=1 Tax=Marivirga harenae TaxID=2010992 RepID=UPI0026DF0021|nr:CoA pyrophosphatase [Marivirga harenae]WKV12685.1 CoA pyrophosphatase [Marivirga harenae]|tara:strand:+ start:5116 stop:5745 length:630 start_codon:yes stop_codon:yes gene_type:complete
MIDIGAFLKDRLKKPLPGDVAHQQMMAQPIGERFNMKYDKPPKKGAVMIALYPDEGKIYFPLMQRPPYQGVHGGQVSLPGGKKEDADSNLIETAIRETYEEIGVTIADNEVIGTLSDLNVTASNFIVRPVISILKSKPEFIRDPREVEHIFKAEVEHLIHPETLQVTELTVAERVRLKAPFFDIEEKVVWGATAMILSEFVEILKEHYT